MSTCWKPIAQKTPFATVARNKVTRWPTTRRNLPMILEAIAKGRVPGISAQARKELRSQNLSRLLVWHGAYLQPARHRPTSTVHPVIVPTTIKRSHFECTSNPLWPNSCPVKYIPSFNRPRGYYNGGHHRVAAAISAWPASI